jgi:hypothetical protein
MTNPSILSAEQILAKMREGYKQDLKIKFGALEIPCRLMSADEESSIIANAKTRVKVINEAQRDVLESLEVMKAVLECACNVSGTPYLSRAVLDKLTSFEIEKLYDDYTMLCRTVNPTFEALTEDEIVNLVQAVKKKNRSSGDLFTWQLAEIGKYFLDKFLPAVSAAGS